MSRVLGYKQSLIGVPTIRCLGEMMGEVKTVDDAGYDAAINGDEWVLVDFWAP